MFCKTVKTVSIPWELTNLSRFPYLMYHKGKKKMKRGNQLLCHFYRSGLTTWIRVLIATKENVTASMGRESSFNTPRPCKASTHGLQNIDICTNLFEGNSTHTTRDWNLNNAWNVSHQVKTQYLHFRFHANCFILPRKILEEISRRSMLFHN